MKSLILCALISLALAAPDLQRPQYHFLPEKGWMNDPNGLMYYNGYYHLFHQFNPNAATWADMHWGHAVSKDMVTWVHLPVALAPDQSYDAGGVFSGSATIVDGVPVITYTGVNKSNLAECQCVAYPVNLNDPFLTEWAKPDINPILPENPAGTNQNFRDPTQAFEVSGRWYMEVGSGASDYAAEGQALLFTTTDFKQWTYVHEVFELSNFQMFECPDIYPVGDAHIQKVSTEGTDWWFTGRWDYENLKFNFMNNKAGKYDWGIFYASKSLDDTANNRRVVFGWITESDSAGPNRGWQGVQSLPRQVYLNADRSISLLPIPEMDQLRGQRFHIGSKVIKANTVLPLSAITSGTQLEINIDFTVQGDASEVVYGVNVRQSYEEWTSIYYTPPVVKEGYSISGNDLFVEHLDSWNECLDLCNGNNACASWSFAPSDVSDPNSVPLCYLKKSGDENWVANQTCHAGIKGLLVANNTKSSLSTTVSVGITKAPIYPSLEKLKIYIDASVIEVFGNDGSSNIVIRSYPTLVESQGVSVYAEGPEDTAVTAVIDAYTMKSIW